MSTDTVSDPSGLPVIDGWLVDDMPHPPPAKKKRSEAVMEGPVLHVESSSGRRQGSQLRLKKTSSSVRSTSGNIHSSYGRSNSNSLLGRCESDQGVMEIDDGLQFGQEDVMFNEDFGVSVSTQPAVRSEHTHSLPQSTQRANPPIEHAQYTTSGPLRIRVRIESKSHLIPCPRKLQDGSETTVEWLAKQAVERYYTQEGVRPEISLSTVDGALLCLSDPVEHVLGHNEEVVGVVKQWLLPPLPERYQVACKGAQKGE